MSGTIKFGDLVEWKLPDEPGKGAALCIGDMAYSTEDSRVILVATSATIGMPINVAHCERVTSGSIANAEAMRRRYENRFPGRLKLLPLPPQVTGTGE